MVNLQLELRVDFVGFIQLALESDQFRFSLQPLSPTVLLIDGKLQEFWTQQEETDGLMIENRNERKLK